MCWGAGVTITGNVVTCRDGADARIGIHVEGLGDQARRPWVHGNAMATITGNVVHGRFRRGIVSMEVHHTVISGNVIADSTWWCIALITADHCVVSSNVLLYSRTAADTQGSIWGPSRSAIMLYRVGDWTIQNPVVVDNTIRVLKGATAEAGIRISGSDVGPGAVDGGRIAGNRLPCHRLPGRHSPLIRRLVPPPPPSPLARLGRVLRSFALERRVSVDRFKLVHVST